MVICWKVFLTILIFYTIGKCNGLLSLLYKVGVIQEDNLEYVSIDLKSLNIKDMEINCRDEKEPPSIFSNFG